MAQTPRSSHGPGATPFDPSQGGETERAERRERSSSRSRAPAVTARQRPSDPALRAAADSIRAGMGASWRTHLGAAAPAARSSSRASLSAVSSPVTLDGSVEAAVVAAPLATSPVESPKYQRRARSPMAPRLSRSSHSNLGASPASRGLAAGDVGLATEIPVAASPPVTPASPASLPVSPRVSGATSRTHALQAASNRHHAARSIGGRAGHAPASPTLVKPGRPRHLSTLLRSRAVRRLVSLLIVVGIIVGIVHGADEVGMRRTIRRSASMMELPRRDRVLEPHELGGVRRYMLPGWLPRIPGTNITRLDGELHVFAKALILQDRRTFLRGFLFFEPLGVPPNPPYAGWVMGSPPSVWALDLHLRVWDGDEMAARLDGDTRISPDIERIVPSRKIATYGFPCAWGGEVSEDGVVRCRRPGETGAALRHYRGMLEFRVDLGVLGQDLVDSPNVRAWLSVDGWHRGIDLTDLLADPQVAEVGAILDDRGPPAPEAAASKAPEQPAAVMTAAQAAAAASSAQAADAGGFVTGKVKELVTNPAAVGKATGALKVVSSTGTVVGRRLLADATDETAGARPFGDPTRAEADAVNSTRRLLQTGLEASADADPLRAMLRADHALYVVRASSRVPAPIPRVVQVWKPTLGTDRDIGTISMRLAEHFFLSGGAALCIYVYPGVAPQYIGDASVRKMVAAGAVTLVRWESYPAPAGWQVYDQLLINHHATLSHWGRNAILMISDIDEIIALPSKDIFPVSANIPGVLRNTGRRLAAEGAGTADGGGRSSEAAAGIAADGHDLYSALDDLLADSRSGMADLPEDDEAPGEAEDAPRGAALGRALLAAQPDANANATAVAATAAAAAAVAAVPRKAVPVPSQSWSAAKLSPWMTKWLGSRRFYSDSTHLSALLAPGGAWPPKTPQDLLDPVTARQKRLANVLGRGGCMHSSQRELIMRQRGRTASELLQPSHCAIVQGRPAYYADGKASKRVPDGEYVANASSTREALSGFTETPVNYRKNWYKPLFYPDAVVTTYVHTGDECLGGRVQPWGRPPPGGVGAPLPLRRNADGSWNVRAIGLPRRFSTTDKDPPIVDSPCRFVRPCKPMPPTCLYLRHLVNLHRAREIDANTFSDTDWLWVHYLADRSQAHV